LTRRRAFPARRASDLGVPGGVLGRRVLDGHVARGHAAIPSLSLSGLELSHDQNGGSTSSGMPSLLRTAASLWSRSSRKRRARSWKTSKAYWFSLVKLTR